MRVAMRRICFTVLIALVCATYSAGDNASWHHYKSKTTYMEQIPECFYRVSVKALILNEARDKFLICKEESGIWELPGGGLDWGMTPQQDLPREVAEEMGISVTKVADHPSYFITDKTINRGVWFVNVLYEAEVEHLDFTPSDECVDIAFVNQADLGDRRLFPSVRILAEQFDPAQH